MKKTLFAAVALVTIASPALADFYIIQEPTTRRCRIVETRPEPNVGVVIGAPFGLRVEAENRMRTIEVCREGTTGRGTVIEEPREREIIIERR
jgi:hypothetical protein